MQPVKNNLEFKYVAISKYIMKWTLIEYKSCAIVDHSLNTS